MRYKVNHPHAKKLKLRYIEDNVPPGGYVHVPGSLIVAFFGEELMKRLARRAKRQSPGRNS